MSQSQQKPHRRLTVVRKSQERKNHGDHSAEAPDNIATRNNIEFDAIKLGEIIGEGGEARVHKAVWEGNEVAVKVCGIQNRNYLINIEKVLRQEVAIHETLNHPNILKMYGVARGPKNVCIVTELMHSSLYPMIFPDEGSCLIPLESKLFIACEILKGISYIHRKDVVHGDMKPENVLVSEDLKSVKICDMGLSRVKKTIRDTRTKSGVAGTPLYMAPEGVQKHMKASKRTDIWTTTATLAEMFSEANLWQHDDGSDVNTFLTKKFKEKKLSSALAAIKQSQPDVLRPTAATMLEQFEMLQIEVVESNV